jgi:glycogen debranching enzyme
MKEVVKKAAKHAARQATRPLLLKTPSKWTSPTLAMRTVTSKSGLGVYASSDAIFKGAVFGRDSLTVAEDLMCISPKLVRQIFLTLASFQGEAYDHVSEEEPGKIIHEHRTRIVDGKPISGITLEVFTKYSFKWGGDENGFMYYGSCDSTPHFVRALTRYCQIYGTDILLEQVVLRSGSVVSMLDVLERSVDWIIRHLHSSKSGLVEYLRVNPNGIENQVWKDSDEFYVHETGALANHNRPIASIEVQAMAYAALTRAADLLPSKAKKWQKSASKLQKRTLGLLWDENRQYFSLGTDFDESGKLRVIKTTAANPAELLDSIIFDNLPDTQRQKYIKGIVSEIFSGNFLTDAGIRSRGLNEANLVPFWDYHGSYTTWPKETYAIAKGLRRQGLPRLALELENRLLNVVKAMRAYPEFLYVDAKGRVLGIARSAHGHNEIVMVEAPNSPERIQAWTVSAILAITDKAPFLNKPKFDHFTEWQQELEKDILRAIPHMPLLKSVKELTARYPAYPYKLRGK